MADVELRFNRVDGGFGVLVEFADGKIKLGQPTADASAQCSKYAGWRIVDFAGYRFAKDANTELDWETAKQG